MRGSVLIIRGTEYAPEWNCLLTMQTLPGFIKLHAHTLLIPSKKPFKRGFFFGLPASIMYHTLSCMSLYKHCYLFYTLSFRFMATLRRNVIEEGCGGPNESYRRLFASLIVLEEEKPRATRRVGESKSFHERCRLLSEMLSSTVLHFWASRCGDCGLMTIFYTCVMTTVAWMKEKQKALYISSIGFTVTRTQAHVPVLSDIRAASSAASPCRTRDIVTGDHCWAGMSQGLSCYLNRSSEWEQILEREWKTSHLLVYWELICRRVNQKFITNMIINYPASFDYLVAEHFNQSD